MIPLTWHLGKDKTIGTENKLAISRGRGWEEGLTNDRVSIMRVFLVNGNTSWLWVQTQLYAFVKAHKAVFHKESILLYLNFNIILSYGEQGTHEPTDF